MMFWFRSRFALRYSSVRQGQGRALPLKHGLNEAKPDRTAPSGISSQSFLCRSPVAASN